MCLKCTICAEVGMFVGVVGRSPINKRLLTDQLPEIRFLGIAEIKSKKLLEKKAILHFLAKFLAY